jgi:hypothetical protein
MAPLYEYLQTPGLRFYRGAQEFIARVEDALTERSPALAEERQAVVRGSSWDTRAGELAMLINSLLSGQRYMHPSTKLHPLLERN